jgi:hypothetical protein
MTVEIVNLKCFLGGFATMKSNRNEIETKFKRNEISILLGGGSVILNFPMRNFFVATESILFKISQFPIPLTGNMPACVIIMTEFVTKPNQ